MSEIIEARQLVDAIAGIRGQLSKSDQKFLETWQTYLENAGDRAAIGRWRLYSLRVVAASHDLIPEPERPVENFGAFGA